MSTRRTLATVALTALLPATLPAQPLGAGTGTATFDAAWERIRTTHPDPQLNGVDWDGVRAELRPRAAAAYDDGELRAVLHEMLQRLGQSHFALIPRERREAAGAGAAAAGTPGLDVRLLDDEVVIRSVAEGSPAAEAGLGAGTVLDAIGGVCAADVVAAVRGEAHWLNDGWRVRARVRGLLQGPAGTHVRVHYHGPDAAGTALLERRPPATAGTSFGLLGPRHPELAVRTVRTHGGAEVGVVRFSEWLLPLLPEVHGAVHALRGAAGIVIDLRGNPGGAGAMVMGLAGLFVNEPVRLGTTIMRSDTLHIVAVPRRVSPDGEPAVPYFGPVAILIEETSGSASETFAGGMQAIGRARVFGRRSAGGVLPSHTFELPNGDVLQHAVGEFRTAAGIRLEGRGVVPDEEVALRKADLIAGRDADLGAALAWLDRLRGDTLPPADSLYAWHVAVTGGRAAYERFAGYTAEGALEIRPLGMRGTIRLHAAAGRTASVVELEGVGTVRSGYADSVAWTVNPALGPLLVEGAERQAARQQADLQWLLHPRRYYETMETAARVRSGERDVYRVRVRTAWGEEFDEFFDVASKLLLGSARRQQTPAGPVNTNILYEDYRDVGAVRTAFRVVQRAAGVEQVMSFDRIQEAEPPAEVFALPREIRSLLGGR